MGKVYTFDGEILEFVIFFQGRGGLLLLVFEGVGGWVVGGDGFCGGG